MEVDLRKEYQPHRDNEDQQLSVEMAPSHPIKLFQEWYNEAHLNACLNNLRDEQGNIKEIVLYEPYAMVLSTVSADHRPRSRVILLREFSDDGLIFYTNYLSDKGKEMEELPYAAANFFWPTIDRQIRIEGKIERTSAERSKRYFASRPPMSQIAAAVSQQSQVLPKRKTLIESVKKYSEPPSCPEHWGGYRLIPDYYEFWLGRRNRLHERLAYRLMSSDHPSPSSWEKHLLYP